ncbi:MAG: FadR family transcriptional regulator [Gammaproteobacteria bacterium]|nr:FadR family transcriptional regulator [Gammaproteobacteria bacterium]
MKQPNRYPDWNAGSSKTARRLAGSIADDLGTAVLRGRFKPGATFSGEIEASKKLRVSRTAYREAIRILIAKGLVESRPKTGTKVSALNSWHLLDPEVLGWAFKNEPDQSLMWGLFELRMVIEPAAAELAAHRRSYAHLAAMQTALETMRRCSMTVDEGRVADRLFHQTLLEATGNAFLTTLSAGISAAIHWTTIYKARTKSIPRDPMPAHERVFEAIRVQNAAEAREGMKDLVQMALEDTQLIVPAGTASEHPKVGRARNAGRKGRRPGHNIA